MRGATPAVATALVATLVLSLTGGVQAQSAPGAPASGAAASSGDDIEDRPYRGARLTWRKEWGEVGTRDYAIVGIGISLAIGKHAIGPTFGKRQGGMLFDEDVRDALRMENLAGERFARDVSDVLLTSAVSYPFFDSLVVAGWYRGSPEVARQMAWINAEAMALTAGLQGVTNIIAGRERPFGRRCGDGKPEEGRDCDSNDRYYSFFSGHTSQAFTAAGLVCIHHAYLPLYGGGFADGGICALGMLTAAATGALRIVGDQHYFTDVAVGAVVGTLSGVGLPWLLFYRHGPTVTSEAPNTELTLQLIPTPSGLTLLGRFQ